MKGAWSLLLSVGLLLFVQGCQSSSLEVCSVNHQNIEHIFSLMKTSGRGIREGIQYGMIYVPDDQSTRYLKLDDSINTGNRIVPQGYQGSIYPPLTYSSDNVVNFPHNYAVLGVDTTSSSYVHSERLALDEVLPAILKHRQHRQLQSPIHVYLYTRIFPCGRCTQFIEFFLKNDTCSKLNLYIAFSRYAGSQRSAGNNGNNGQIRRRDYLNQTLIRKGRGMLFEIDDDEPNRLMKYRHKRSAISPCHRKPSLEIKMNFTTGHAQASWYLPQAANDEYWYVQLWKKKNKIAYKWLNSRIVNTVTFNEYISHGAYLTLHYYDYQLRRYNPDPYLISNIWISCGFGHMKLDRHLSVSQGGGTIYMATHVAHGYAIVILTFCNGAYDDIDIYDKVMLQAKDNANDENYITYSHVTNMNTHFRKYNKVVKYKRFGLSSDYSRGFRAKYVAYDENSRTFYYGNEGTTAGPYWTPSVCNQNSNRCNFENIIPLHSDPCEN